MDHVSCRRKVTDHSSKQLQLQSGGEGGDPINQSAANQPASIAETGKASGRGRTGQATAVPQLPGRHLSRHLRELQAR